MAKRGAVPALYAFTRYEEHIITQIDESSGKKQITVRSIKSLTFSTYAPIYHKHTHKRKLTD